jgi:hypothetical protein
MIYCLVEPSCLGIPWVVSRSPVGWLVVWAYSPTKAHDWMVGVLEPLFRTAGHTVRTQHGVTASAGQLRGDVELRTVATSTRRCGPPEPGLRPVHDPRPFWEQ